MASYAPAVIGSIERLVRSFDVYCKTTNHTNDKPPSPRMGPPPGWRDSLSKLLKLLVSL